MTGWSSYLAVPAQSPITIASDLFEQAVIAERIGENADYTSRRADMAGPVIGKWQGRNGLFGHENPL
jgi:hypothetical protein